MKLSHAIKTFYEFITKEGEMQSSYVTTATATICEPKWLATDKTGRCHAYTKKPEWDERNGVWIEQDKKRHKIFVFKLPASVPFNAAETLMKLNKKEEDE